MRIGRDDEEIEKRHGRLKGTKLGRAGVEVKFIDGPDSLSRRLLNIASLLISIVDAIA